MNPIALASACALGLIAALPAGAHSGPAHVHLAGGLVMYAGALALPVMAAAWLTWRVLRRAPVSREEPTDAVGNGRHPDPAARA